MPLFIVLFGFSVHQAVPISNLNILAGAVVRIIINWKQQHPEKENKLAVDYDLVIFLLPMILLGTMIGVMLNIVLPSVIIIAGLTLVLVYLDYMCITKGMKLYKKENEEKAKKK